jgi:hypothetical protein
LHCFSPVLRAQEDSLDRRGRPSRWRAPEGGSSLGTVLERAAPAPPVRARGPGGGAGRHPVHRSAGHRHRAVHPGQRLGGRARARLGELRGRGEGLEAFQCATAVVPLDYDKPKGRQITLALARLPASDPSRRIGSLFLNPGGPGGSGVDMVLQGGPFLYSDEVRARFDLVGFDPRGIIRSTPLRCYETFDEAIADLPPFQFPVTREEERIQIRSNRALARACAERGGPSSTTCRAPTSPATWTCCAGPSATPS